MSDPHPDQTLGRKVAVKVLHPHLVADDSFVKRFRKEAIAAARLTHPGIVGVYDTCSDGTHEGGREPPPGAALDRIEDRGVIDSIRRSSSGSAPAITRVQPSWSCRGREAGAEREIACPSH